ncbi:MAG: flexitail domain-containing putative surface protein, partial [Dehalococcoidia bacterium]|nr:flexitail domain-containing putative surface protein [Dehalococcoidia bacterium]
ITGLPSSAPFYNHLTNGLTFDDQGRLFIAQGSSTDTGLAGSNYWPETPLSAAILMADIHSSGFDGAITYSPAGSPANDNVDQVGGDVDVYAPGVRNPYDLVIHSNGYIYATDNGATGVATSTGCATSGGSTSTSDELNLIEQGNYYGFPNRNRGLGIPDARQCVYHAPQEGNGVGFTGPINILPSHCSCDGIIEYTSAAFGGALQGNLMHVEWTFGRITRTVLAPNGRSVTSTSTLASALNQPLDLTQGADGTIYVAEFGDGEVTFFAPDSDRDGCHDSRELGPDEMLGGRRNPANQWDFYDVTKDGTVSLLEDIFDVAAAFGSKPGVPSYDPDLDRSAAPAGADPWDMGPPDGTVDLFVDIFGVAAQFGHMCV